MNGHSHYGEYADARHDHRSAYADARHDHDLDYAGKHHRHYDDERVIGELQRELRELRHELRNELASALDRIRQLEQQAPQARQLGLGADQAAADLAESGYDRDEGDDEAWRTLADYQVASGTAEYDEDEGCVETSNGRHTASWHEGGKCAACGLYGPQDDDEDDL